jgi:HEAT repeat protein
MPAEPIDSNPRNRLDAAVAAAESGDFSGLELIVDALGHDDPDIRGKAAYRCQRIGIAAAIAPLSRMVAKDDQPDNRSQAMYALCGIGRPAVVSPLITALSDPDEGCRESARTALFRVIGPKVLPYLADEEGGGEPDPDESDRVAEWWGTHSQRFDPALVYTKGEPASPGAFIRQLKTTKTALPDAIYGALHDWTGQGFGTSPKPKVIAKWETWWNANRARYRRGHRYFFGYLVP